MSDEIGPHQNDCGWCLWHWDPDAEDPPEEYIPGYCTSLDCVGMTIAQWVRGRFKLPFGDFSAPIGEIRGKVVEELRKLGIRKGLLR